MDAKRAAEVLLMVGNADYREECVAGEMGAQALEAWAWVERHVDEIDIRGDRTTSDGWVTVTYNDGNRAEGATVYAAVLDAMEKGSKG
jgi:hypothetical protein